MTPAHRLADIVDHLAELDAITVDDPSGIFAELLADYRRTQSSSAAPAIPPGGSAV